MCRHNTATPVMVYQERAFSKGGVPFPSSRWRFYNIHPTCTHVEMVIFVSAFPLLIYLSAATSKNTLAAIEISTDKKDRVFFIFLSLSYVVGVLCRPAFDLRPFENPSLFERYRRLRGWAWCVDDSSIADISANKSNCDKRDTLEKKFLLFFYYNIKRSCIIMLNEY